MHLYRSINLPEYDNAHAVVLCSCLQLLAVGVGLSGLFLGIAIPAFYEGQTKGAVSFTSALVLEH